MRDTSVVILDFGSQFTQLIARAVRELGVYCEIEPYSISQSILQKKNPKALILSGGPESVSAKNSPKLLQSILTQDLPILGICYGMQLLSFTHKGKVKSSSNREYGSAEITVLSDQGLFQRFTKNEKAKVWMSHGDSVESLPPTALITARSEQCPVAAFQMGNLHAVQFHPEVSHTEIGKKILENFLFSIAQISPGWKMENFLEQKAEEIHAQVGKHHVIGGISGGVDSTVLAVFLSKILGDQFHPVFVDNGLLRKNEEKEVPEFLKKLGVSCKVVKAGSLFLQRLKSISDPEKKRKIIGKTFIEVFEQECKRQNSKQKEIRFLAQGTLYPDVIESVSVKGPSHTIKTHHNVGGLPKKMHLSLVEPFRELFKDEVRAMGRDLNIPEEILQRFPFPGPGLAIRVLGEVTPKRLAILKEADAIFLEEIRREGLYSQIWQAFVVLLPICTVGVMGDARTYESVVSLRAVVSRDGMTADWFAFEKKFLSRVANRIINEVKGINRVVYDVSSKPPATIEWE